MSNKTKQSKVVVFENGRTFIISDNGIVDEEVTPKTYREGCIFRSNGHLYVLAQVLPRQFCMVSLVDGNRYKDPIKYKGPDNNGTRKLSQEFVESLISSHAVFVTDNINDILLQKERS